MAFEGRRCVGGLLLSDQLERVPNMERKAVIEFLATLPPADLLNMVAEVARLRDCRAAEAAPSSGSGGRADCTRERTAANARRGRSSSTAERRAKRQAESRVALATAVARR